MYLMFSALGLPRTSARTSIAVCVVAGNSHSALQYAAIKNMQKPPLTKINKVVCLLLFVKPFII